MVAWIQEATDGGAHKARACAETGLLLRTVQRWTEEQGMVKADARTTVERPAPANKLSEAEVQQVLDACHRPDTAHLPPTQIVPRLADEGSI